MNIDKDVVITNDVNDNGLSNNKKSDQVSISHQKLPSKRPQVVVNNNPENQKTFSRLPVIPGKDKYNETVKAKPEPMNTLIFTDSIPKGIRMYGFNKSIKNRKSSSKQEHHQGNCYTTWIFMLYVCLKNAAIMVLKIFSCLA